MKAYFKDLFHYNQWANNKVMETFLNQEEVPEKALLYMSHIIMAEITWISRTVPGNYPPVELWKAIALNELRQHQVDYDKRWIDLVDQETDFDLIVSYRNTKGQTFSNKLSDIMAHVVNHSSYHRGQVAMDLKANGYQAVSTDYILYKRE